MKINKVVLCIITIMLILSVTGCASEYDVQVKLFNAKFKEIANKIDPEKITESIQRNNLVKEVDNLGEIVENIEMITPTKELENTILIKQKYSTLIKFIQSGLKWDSLEGLEKLSAQDRLQILMTYKN